MCGSTEFYCTGRILNRKIGYVNTDTDESEIEDESKPINYFKRTGLWKCDICDTKVISQNDCAELDKKLRQVG